MCYILSLLALLSAPIAIATLTGTTPLYQYYSSGTIDHIYSDWSELGTGAYGYTYQKSAFCLIPTAAPGTTPLYRYWNPTTADHFYTSNWSEMGSGLYGYSYEKIAGYVYTTQVSGTVPLYRYWNSASTDHAYTITSGEFGSGYSLESVPGYVYACPSACTGGGSGSPFAPCSSGNTCCNGQCVNLQTDSDNCGTCGVSVYESVVNGASPCSTSTDCYINNNPQFGWPAQVCNNGLCVSPCSSNSDCTRMSMGASASCLNGYCYSQCTAGSGSPTTSNMCACGGAVDYDYLHLLLTSGCGGFSEFSCNFACSGGSVQYNC